ncbi:MAG: transketolase [Patescibacteria group bacterium]
MRGAETMLEEEGREIRRHIVDMACRAGGGHVAPSLSCVEILVALYYRVLSVENPRWENRDRFILSKGHAALALYAVLARKGYFPQSWLDTYGLAGGKLGGMSEPTVPGVVTSTGALGHGLSVGAGMAWAARMEGSPYRVFVLMGDGECQEGSVWEAAAFAGHHQLSNLTAIIDRNRLQALDETERVTGLEPLGNRWRSFGWQVAEVDGHDVNAVADSLERPHTGPRILIARTIKGRGVSYMENQAIWHYRIPNQEEKNIAESELRRPCS